MSEDKRYAIDVENLSRTFEDGTEALKGIKIKLEEGQTGVIVGPSGSGKTVLLHHMIGRYAPQTGYVKILGNDISSLRENKLNDLRRRWGVVFQGNALLTGHRTDENISMNLKFINYKELTKDQVNDRVSYCAKIVGLEEEDLYKTKDQLSGGMQKRVAIARAIFHDPELLFFDEPTSGLDPLRCIDFYKLIDKVNKEGIGNGKKRTNLIITHDLYLAFILADNLYTLHEGELLFGGGSPQEFLESSDPKIKAFGILSKCDPEKCFEINRRMKKGESLDGLLKEE